MATANSDSLLNVAEAKLSVLSSQRHLLAKCVPGCWSTLPMLTTDTNLYLSTPSFFTAVRIWFTRDWLSSLHLSSKVSLRHMYMNII